MKLPRWTGFNDKTLWDVLSLLGVPVALVVIGALFSQMQTEVSERNEDRRASLQREIEDGRVVEERRLAEERAELDRQSELERYREEVLQTYIDRIAELILVHGLSNQPADERAAQVARGRTLTALIQLDEKRKSQVIRFLFDSRLIGYYSADKGASPTVNIPAQIDLSGADLQGVVPTGNLSGVNLSYTKMDGAQASAYMLAAVLTGADLSEAELSGVELSGSELNAAMLRGANLSDALLFGANFNGADLTGANLAGATLIGATFEDTILAGVVWDGAICPDGSQSNSNSGRSCLDHFARP